jgi:hypothetical protein
MATIVGLVAFIVFRPTAVAVASVSMADTPAPNALVPNMYVDPAPPFKTERFDYSQLGILTRGDTILPLMGRRMRADRWQYYTMSNTGVINTKLPMSVKGRSCTGEYGCDMLMNGDTVFVEGYKQSFSVTLYETAAYQYCP